jgi:hypothetical protein
MTLLAGRPLWMSVPKGRSCNRHLSDGGATASSTKRCVACPRQYHADVNGGTGNDERQKAGRSIAFIRSVPFCDGRKLMFARVETTTDQDWSLVVFHPSFVSFWRGASTGELSRSIAGCSIFAFPYE